MAKKTKEKKDITNDQEAPELQPKEQAEEPEKIEEVDEITKLKEQISDLEDKLKREKADAINYRRRIDEEKMRALRYGNEELVLEILPVLDNFERAIDMDDDNPDDEVSRFLEGVKMIHENLKSTLGRFDVEVIDELNEPFDPSCHDAVATECVTGVEPNTVIEVLQKGYRLKDKVIRPAIVKVSE